jgi:hypothetical protein
MTTRDFAERDPGPPDVVDSHCCAHPTGDKTKPCIDSREAKDLREHLTVLSREVHDGYRNDVVGSTPLERIGCALDRVDARSKSFANGLFLRLESIAGELRLLAAVSIPVCNLRQYCLDCQGEDGPRNREER